MLWHPEDLMLYEYDALSSLRQPDVVVFPRTTGHVVQIAKLALRHNLQLVARGAGTGLSGGSVAAEGGILLGFSRMKQILEIDLENQRARVQPGVVNLDLSLAVADDGLLFRTRSFQPEGLHDRRQRGGEFRRSAHAGLWSDHESRAGAWRWCCRMARLFTPAPATGTARVRPFRPVRGFGRHARHHYRSHRAVVSQARSREDPAGGLQRGRREPLAPWPPSPRAASLRRRWR